MTRPLSRLPLPRGLRTSSFVLTMVYAGLFVLSGSILFGVVSWSITRATRLELQRDVDDEMNEVKATAGTLDLPRLQHVIAQFAATSPNVHYLLQDRAGRVLAGNMAAMAPIPGAHEYHRRRKPFLMRGRGKLLADGFLFVGIDDQQTPRLRAAVSHAFVIAFAATVLLALAGGAAMSLGMLRRVEKIGRASRDIMAGDLHRRLPLSGTGDEFDQLGASLNAMLDRIATLMEQVQHVSSDIAHDLRTPLTRMRQRLELALAQPATVELLRAALERALAELDAILATFAALLRIAQVEARRRQSNFTTVDLAELAAGLSDAYQPVAEQRGQALRTESLARVHLPGDRALLTQMIVNLIENAIRHTPPGTLITVGVALRDRQPVLIVTDRGAGIPAADRAAVLTRFHRLDSSRSTPGNGLGLPLVAAIAGLHHAELVLEDHSPGLRVRIVFPPIDAAPALRDTPVPVAPITVVAPGRAAFVCPMPQNLGHQRG